jgi:NDP-sugar pyrophosphorylase family protein
MKAVILAGGLGSRLKPFTEVIPKPLLPVGEKAVLEIQIERFRAYGFDNIFLATNYKSDYIKSFFGDGSRYGVHLTISQENDPLGTAGPLRLLQEQLTEPFLVMNGDILTLADLSRLYRFALDQKNLLTVTIKKLVLPYAFGNILFEGDRVTGIQEKPDIITYAMAGIYVVDPALFPLIPENRYFGMDSLIRRMLEDNIPIGKYEIEEYWLDIGQIEDYEKAQAAYESHFKEVTSNCPKS